MSYSNEAVVTIEIYDGLNRKYCRHIRFKLTPERIIKAIEKINSILSWQVKRAHIKPLVIPDPEDEGIAPEWLIRELTFRDDYKGIRVDKKVLEAVFTELREKGLLKYATEFAAERRKEDE